MNILHMFAQIVALLTLFVFLALMTITFWQMNNLLLTALIFVVWAIVGMFLTFWFKS